MANRRGKSESSERFYFERAPKSLQIVAAVMKLKLAPWKKSYDNPRQQIQKQRCHFADKGPSSQSYGFSSSRVWMWELDHKEGWVPKNWCFWTVVLEQTLESPLDSKEIRTANSKGNQPWVFIGRTDAVAEAPILWPPDVKSWLIGKDPDAGKDWGQKVTEDEMVGWHHWTWLSEHESEQTPGDSEGQGSLECCSPWGRRVGHDWATGQQKWSRFLQQNLGSFPKGSALTSTGSHWVLRLKSKEVETGTPVAWLQRCHSPLQDLWPEPAQGVWLEATVGLVKLS